jgi:hypothetical protein
MKNTFIETRKATNIFQMYSKLTFKETIGKLTRYKHAENMFGGMRIKRNKKPNTTNYIFTKLVYYNRLTKYPTIAKFINRGYLYDKIRFIDRHTGPDNMPYLKSGFRIHDTSLINYSRKEQNMHLNEDIYFTKKGFMKPYGFLFCSC